ncbi:hypothetical protein L3X38_024523 [Prunus dulcis]|uniref:Uncharacterized protein n=1 Tax=Prunus dulcis TaxID=3755 RepID=A0AAD4Z686_PRUDU|nr:hypothetical protein L3X38_024523 [Prunus dulcis]
MATKFQSENTYALVTTKGLHWDLIQVATVPHAPPQSDTNRRKIRKAKGQGSYPRLKTSFGATFVLGHSPKTGRKWPELKFKIRPKLRVSK